MDRKCRFGVLYQRNGRFSVTGARPVSTSAARLPVARSSGSSRCTCRPMRSISRKHAVRPDQRLQRLRQNHVVVRVGRRSAPARSRRPGRPPRSPRSMHSQRSACCDLDAQAVARSCCCMQAAEQHAPTAAQVEHAAARLDQVLDALVVDAAGGARRSRRPASGGRAAGRSPLSMTGWPVSSGQEAADQPAEDLRLEQKRVVAVGRVDLASTRRPCRWPAGRRRSAATAAG